MNRLPTPETMYRQQISTAIDDAVRCLPPEIRNITVDYGERSHTWTSFETVSATTEDGATKIVRAADVDFGCRRRLLVSAQTFATGRLRWSVEYKPFRTAENDGWIAAGFTTASTNCANPVRTFVSSCLLYLQDYYGISIEEDQPDDFRSVSKFLPTRTTLIRVGFEAFPSTATVTASIDYISANGDWQSAYQVDLNAKPIANFADMRPCVVLSGQNSVVVRS